MTGVCACMCLCVCVCATQLLRQPSRARHLTHPLLPLLTAGSAVHPAPGCDVVDAATRQPRLLLLDPDELPGRLAAIITKLTQLHPSHMEHVVAGACARAHMLDSYRERDSYRVITVR
jgi:hypothetical protein